MKKLQTLFTDDFTDISLYQREDSVYSILHNVSYVDWHPTFTLQGCSLELQYKTLHQDYENPQDDPVFEILIKVSKASHKQTVLIRDETYFPLDVRIC